VALTQALCLLRAATIVDDWPVNTELALEQLRGKMELLE
jgi:hypothetical protein